MEWSRSRSRSRRVVIESSGLMIFSRLVARLCSWSETWWGFSTLSVSLSIETSPEHDKRRRGIRGGEVILSIASWPPRP